ncbi:MAG: DUF5050 domain-containing protein [Defluviitaleaceae bacterium]|nr:DUF5050 domain-containing protein [Defluviitaleaceae bacterium]
MFRLIKKSLAVTGFILTGAALASCSNQPIETFGNVENAHIEEAQYHALLTPDGEELGAILPEPSPYTYGNTSGNLTNSGFVAEYGDYIFYIMPVRHEYMMWQGDLIRENVNTGETRILASGERQSFINVYNGWVYFVQPEVGQPILYRVRLDGTELTRLIDKCITDRNQISGMTVSEGWIYIAYTTGIYRLPAEGGEVEQIHGFADIPNPRRMQPILTVYNGWIYYRSAETEWRVYKMRLDGTEITPITEDVNFAFQIANGRIFYIQSGEWQIKSINLDGTNRQRVGEVGVFAINVTDEWIYFITKDGVHKMRLDATESQIIQARDMAIIPSGIGIAGDWLYFLDGGQPGGDSPLRTYRISKDGSILQEAA